MPEQSKMGVINFGAGPAKLPPAVLEKIHAQLLDYEGGMSILETSHRSPTFDKIIRGAEDRVRRLVGGCEEHAVLFMQGGGTLQFSAAPMNLAGKDETLWYIATGQWSRKAAEEAEALGYNVKTVELELSEGGLERAREIIHKDGAPSYLYYCDNETIDGIEFPSSQYLASALSLDPALTTIVCDMSSNFLSRPIDVSQFGLIFATAQKNIGPAGVTIVLVRKDLLQRGMVTAIPKMLDYRVFAKDGSLYNTPPVFSIYATGLVIEHLESEFDGSLEAIDQFSKHKSSILYDAIDQSAGKLVNKVPHQFRSRMNVVWQTASPEDESLFLKEAKEHGMVQLKGHRSVGGMRASIYNAITVEETQQLADLINKTLAEHIN